MEMRILGLLSIYGSKSSLERIKSVAPIPLGKLGQIGLKRQVPEPDSWCYSSPYYRFHLEKLDEEVRAFLDKHAHLGKALSLHDKAISYALLTLIPVELGDEETFACMLSHETIQTLSHLGVGLEISPEASMPDAPYWTDQPA